VLMGETGPNAFRKLTATILATVAQQAAVMAIMSLAYAALATTAIGAILLGGTPAQFLQAAALFGAVAVAAAVAGRVVAGNAFKQPAAPSNIGGGRAGGKTESGGDTSKTFNMGRNQVVEHLVIIRAEPGFIARETVKAIDNNHPQLNKSIKKVANS